VPEAGRLGRRQLRHPRLVGEDRAAGAGRGGIDREHRHLVAALDQERAKRVDGSGFSDPRRAGDSDPDGLAGFGQQRLDQFARGGLVIAAPALDQRDRTRERRALACAQLLGQFANIWLATADHCVSSPLNHAR